MIALPSTFVSFSQIPPTTKFYQLWVHEIQSHLLQYQYPYRQQMLQNTKWTPEQDERLKAAVRKHGTQWQLVGKEINHVRSQNAIIKRWHGYLRKGFEQSPAKSTPAQQKSQSVKQSNSKNDSSSESEQLQDQNEQNQRTERENIEAVKKIEQQPYQFKLIWSQEDDIKLKNHIIADGILLWDKLAQKFATTEQEIKARWIKVICPKLKNNVKIGGALKWSVNEDCILYAADRNNIPHYDLIFFLPVRTVYSIEARWRRICKNSDAVNHLAVVNNRNAVRREALKKIALKRCFEKRDQMTKIYEKEKEIIEKQKTEQDKYQMMRRQDKMRKIERL